MKKAFLEGEKIYLRPIEKSDLTETYRDWFNDAEVCRFNSHHRFPNYDEDMNEYYKKEIKSGRNLILAIVAKKSHAHIGNISLQDIDLINRHAELAIIIGDKRFWNKGVGKEAGQLIIGHGFRELNLHRIYCGTSVDNVGMQKLAGFLGFKKEGIQRESIFKEGAYKDTVLYGLLQHERRR